MRLTRINYTDARSPDIMLTVLQHFLMLSLSVAPWLLLGLMAAGMVKGLLAEATLQRWLGGRGPLVIARAAVIGAPLPLCSCGAIPTAMALHRGGARRGPTTAFLIGTPGIGIDSVAVTYALLGPFMAIARGASAIITGITTGLLVATTDAQHRPVAPCSNSPACCSQYRSDNLSPALMDRPLRQKLVAGLGYAFSEVLDDISRWIVAGLLFASLLMTVMPPEQLAVYGSGVLAMLLMAVIGMPLYLCATAATPIGAGLLLAGVSPGTVLVFLLAAPITSLATLGVVRREMGHRALLCYLVGILLTSILLGLAVDLALTQLGMDVIGQIGTVREFMPEFLEWSALGVLLIVALPPLRRGILAAARGWPMMGWVRVMVRR
jgi:uncharacterized membrane protein YraQ (UPF0718 family)